MPAMTAPEGKIVLCPTPIGNLGDVTRRAFEALSAADVVCAEDTRVTGRLLAALGVSVPLARLDEATIGERAAAFAARAAAGDVVAYCTDAGMPGVSDPGRRLVAAAREAGVRVEVLPGPTAAATAYVASGTENPRYYFGGFLPRRAAERRASLESLRALDAALVFYESPNRVASALATVADAFPTRAVAVCRELTKLHEEVFRAPAPAAAAEFARREAEGGVKGEVVLVIDGPTAEEGRAESDGARAAAAERAADLAAAGMRTKEAARLIADEFGIGRNEAYGFVIAAKGESPREGGSAHAAPAARCANPENPA